MTWRVRSRTPVCHDSPAARGGPSHPHPALARDVTTCSRSPSARSSSASSGSSSTPRRLAAAQRISRNPRVAATPRPARARERAGAAHVLSRPRRGHAARSARSPRRRNGWSTTTTSSTSSCATSATICRAASIASCRSWPRGTSQGYPRVLGLAWAFVAHTDSRFDPDALRRFVQAYQRVQPLLDRRAVGGGDHVARRAGRESHGASRSASSRARADRHRADQLADGLLGIGGRDAAEASATLPRLPDAVTAAELRRPARPAAARAGPDAWCRRCAGSTSASRNSSTTTDDIVRQEHEAQAAMNVTVRNVITSMRLMSAFDWKAFFESVSLVDEVLRAGSGFADMDFTTRDRYRHAIERLARSSGHSEIDVARRAVAKATEAAADATTERRARPRLLPDRSRTRAARAARSAFAPGCGAGCCVPTSPPAPRRTSERSPS